MLPRCFALVVALLGPVMAAQYNCSSDYDRIPVNADLTVDCGPQVISLTVNLCTALYAGLDPQRLALNSQHNNSQCNGTVDTSVSPPVIRYRLPVNSSLDNTCRTTFQARGLAFPVRLQVVDEGPGTGPFAQFSNVQSVLVTGYIDNSDTSEGIITYSTDLFYRFNCRYPLEYLLENMPLITSSVSAAINGNNGSFISTLSLKIYNDSTYTSQLVVPDTGIQLRTKIYVEVGARNLTGNFNVLLDHCFATPSPFGTTTVKHTFFIGCTKDAKTTVLANGASQSSRFLFDAFRFREQLNSTVYLHCVTRLCEPSTCQQLLSVSPSRPLLFLQAPGGHAGGHALRPA
ncbi:ZPLD1 protein, partial [Atractosteus spatula]|nr:ZPLD1 protein [Atractosteus spatula]